MKKIFIFLILFAAKICVAQKQLQFVKVHFTGNPISKATPDTTAKTYFLNENQEVRLSYYDERSNQIFEEYGAIKNITDSTICIKNETIKIKFITEIAFDKSMNSKFRRRIGRALLIPQAVFTAGFATGFIGSFTKWDVNSRGEFGSAPSGFMLVGFLLTVFYLPIDFIALGTMAFTRHHLNFLGQTSKRGWIIRVVKTSSKI